MGDDTLGRTLVRELEDAGVEARVQRAGRTGAIVVLVDAVGERTMITDRGAAAELEPIDPSWLAGRRVGAPAALRIRRAGVAGGAARCRARPSPRAGCRSASISRASRRCATSAPTSSRRSSREVAPAVVFANADEAALGSRARRRSRRRPPSTSSSAAAIRSSSTSTDTAHEVPVERVADVLDSTGAGDAFAAGYIAAALGGAVARESARAGSVLAMSALRRAGAL